MNAFRSHILLSLLVVTPIGFASKFYHGPLAWWLNDHFGGFLYEIFWVLLVALLWPKFAALKTAFGVFLATVILEFLQLWQPPLLQKIRSTFLGRTLMGTTFTWFDFPYYLLGCALGWLWVSFLKRKCG